MSIKLGGVVIKNPSSFKIERYNLTKAGRVASGKMTLDLIAKKRKFFFEYEVISATELTTILNIIDGDALFFTIEYEENGIAKSATVYVGAIPQELFRSSGEWYWKNVNFNLIEQ